MTKQEDEERINEFNADKNFQVVDERQDLCIILGGTKKGFGISDICYFNEGESYAIESVLAAEVLACGGYEILDEDKGLAKLLGDGK